MISRRCFLCQQKSIESKDDTEIYCNTCKDKLKNYGLEETFPDDFYPMYLLNLCSACAAGSLGKDKLEKVIIDFENFYKDNKKIFIEMDDLNKDVDEHIYEAKTKLLDALEKYLEGLDSIKGYIKSGELDFITQGLAKTKEGNDLYKKAMLKRADSIFHWEKILSEGDQPILFNG